MFRKDILSIFFEYVKIDKDGNYIIDMGREQCYLDVEDTVFVVEYAEKIRDEEGKENLKILLTDDKWESLDLNTLYVGKDNIFYCRVKDDKFPARFSRKGYYQLAKFIEEDKNDYFFIFFNDEKHIIKNV
jgi:hypothetical protein